MNFLIGNVLTMLEVLCNYCNVTLYAIMTRRSVNGLPHVISKSSNEEKESFLAQVECDEWLPALTDRCHRQNNDSYLYILSFVVLCTWNFLSQVL